VGEPHPVSEDGQEIRWGQGGIIRTHGSNDVSGTSAERGEILMAQLNLRISDEARSAFSELAKASGEVNFLKRW
jgi:hypothetical protein